ncbi:translation initiation factor IF-2-like [Cygnus olor]|uniref:translation initiation factor IF-2-like n=1 Tax=Cygnus olor TaxID=8869 RepID=UPI001ADE6F4C|nr:translation initiation factor IF-2-like [Cygnus olor]
MAAVPGATSPGPSCSPFVPAPCPRCHPGEPSVPAHATLLAASPCRGTPVAGGRHVAAVGPGPVPVPSPWGTRGARWPDHQPSCSSPTSPGSAAGDVLGSRARTQSVFPPPRCPHLLPPRGRGRSSLPGTGRVKGWLERVAAHLLMGSCQEKHKGGGRPLPRAPQGQVLPLVPAGRLGSPSCFPSQSRSCRKAPRPLRGEQPLSQVPASVPRPQPRARRLQPQHQTEGTQRGAEASAAEARNLRAALERGRKGLLKVFLIKGSAVHFCCYFGFWSNNVLEGQEQLPALQPSVRALPGLRGCPR